MLTGILCVCAGICRASRYKRRLTGGRLKIHQKKKKYEMGRPAASTKLGSKSVHAVRVRGGNHKYRALRLDSGSYSWGSEAIARKARILDVVYNGARNELVRTKTLVKGAIIQIDATPYRQWYEQRYGLTLGKVKAGEESKTEFSAEQRAQHEKLASQAVVENNLKDQFNVGRLYAIITSRPGQSGRSDGYILEQKELEFYLRKLSAKKK